MKSSARERASRGPSGAETRCGACGAGGIRGIAWQRGYSILARERSADQRGPATARPGRAPRSRRGPRSAGARAGGLRRWRRCTPAAPGRRPASRKARAPLRAGEGDGVEGMRPMLACARGRARRRRRRCRRRRRRRPGSRRRAAPSASSVRPSCAPRTTHRPVEPARADLGGQLGTAAAARRGRRQDALGEPGGGGGAHGRTA